MANFVLVHGAWQTAATWDLTAPRLRKEGHSIFIPLLAGLEKDGRKLSAEIGLQTHIDDVLAGLRRDDLRDVVLVGHSYAGMVVTGVAEEALERLNRLIYVDAFVPADGRTAFDYFPEPLRQKLQKQAASAEEGWRLPANEGQLDLWGLKPGPARDFVRARQSDFSLRCFEEPVRLPRNAAAKLPRAYIACVAEDYPARPVFKQFAERAKHDGWGYHELATGHDCHVEEPDAFVSLLLDGEG
jgi:pimeloyl-ACP methyl ester carboxylesterase